MAASLREEVDKCDMRGRIKYEDQVSLFALNNFRVN